MTRKYFIIPLFLVLTTLGCATARPKRAETVPDANSQVSQLQGELQAKDRQIQDLQYQLQSSQSSIQSSGSSNFSSGGKTSSYIRVSGVSVEDVQRALVQAGLDPGPVDGKMGKKTKSAIKSFQRKHNLSADGVIGEKTWSYLKP